MLHEKPPRELGKIEKKVAQKFLCSRMREERGHVP